ncbi:hypothetical protein KKD52_07510 [Myxococcota bacterium]|nr:hypothetical protein [Myxococcota bacterium]MBU1412222.1 hypothetical protein [Myxococcota bacterium]MBU1510194.1 hypothetical protein [Myxococcota bacterium]
MPAELYTPEVADILPSKRHVAFRAGHKGLPGPDDPMYAPLAAAYREGTRLIAPRGAWLTLSVEPSDPVPGGVLATCGNPGSAGNLRRPEKGVGSYAGTLPAEFAGVTEVTLGATTVGPALDDAIAAAMDAGRQLPGVLLDAFGSEAVEGVSEALDAMLRARHGRGTRRFSPGYGDLSILENAAILSRLGIDFVTANSATGILHPRKSTVFLIGWFEEEKTT